MSERRSVTIMLHRDGDLESHSIRLPLWLARTVVIGGSTLGVLIVIGAVLYAPIARTAARVPGLTGEVERLRAENEMVHELAERLEEAEARYDQVRTMMGGDVVSVRGRTQANDPVAHALLARAPSDSARYEEGSSIPRHWPLDEPGIITRGTVGSGSGSEAHSGLDIAVPLGTPIRAAGGGMIEQAGQDPEYGLFVLIGHPDSYQSMYGHASRLLVQAGDSVRAGQVIAMSGSTGRSTAPHLHFEVLREGRSIDPRSLVREES